MTTAATPEDDSDPDDESHLTPPTERGDGNAAPSKIDLSFLSPAQRDDSLGRLAHYEVHQVIGRGGFGIVFNAFDTKLHRLTAVKVMDEHAAASAPARRRFLREARSAAAVRHENVVQIYGVEESPLPYIAMEYIEGETLQQKLHRAGRIGVDELLTIAVQLAHGLSAAHAEGLIHRDIKPCNILLERRWRERIKITDFGLARAPDDDDLTQSGLILGTPKYMAPEQAQGEELDERTDLYSLGVVLYQMAVGRPPFEAPTPLGIIAKVVDEPPVPICSSVADFPPWFDSIVLKLLEKDPRARFATAQELAELLEQCRTEWMSTGRVTCVPSVVIGDTLSIDATTTGSRNVASTARAESDTATGSMRLSSSRTRSFVPLVVVVVIAGAALVALAYLNGLFDFEHRDSIARGQSAEPTESDSGTSSGNPGPAQFASRSTWAGLTSEQLTWSAPKLLRDGINSTGNENKNPTLTEDEGNMVFIHNRRELWEARRSDSSQDFKNVQNLALQGLPPSFELLNCSMTADGLRLILRAGDASHSGLYEVTRESRDQSFGRAELLRGFSLEGPEQNRAPVISPDGLTLAMTRPEKDGSRVHLFRRSDLSSAFQFSHYLSPATRAWKIAAGIHADGSLIRVDKSDATVKVFLHRLSATGDGYDEGRPVMMPAGEKIDLPTFSSDGRRLYYHKRKEGGASQIDIWICHVEVEPLKSLKSRLQQFGPADNQ
ncbi:MAG: serine/threonine-protein kinase [Pirellulales bacterium]